MAHFAKVVNQIVVDVIVADSEFINSLPDKDFWLQTSFNTHGGKHFDPETGLEDNGQPLRKNFAGIGYMYDDKLDAFIPPTPFPSWTLNIDTCLWEPPIPYPSDNKQYIWNELHKEWTPITRNYRDENYETSK